MESTTSGSVGRQRTSPSRIWTRSLLSVILLISPGWHLNSPDFLFVRAQECGATNITTPFTIEDDTGVSMLRAAASCINGGVLEVGWAGAIILDTPISIASGMFLSIIGEGDGLTEVSGGSETRMFEVSAGGQLSLTQLTLSGGNASSGGGGAIYSESATLALDNCSFHGNVAAAGDGGAVWADGGEVTIVGGEFVGNNASVYGGAVAATGATLVVQQASNFEGNTALIGGAVYCSGIVTGSGLPSSSSPLCSLSDSDFIANTATGETDETAVLDDDSSGGVDGGGAVVIHFSSANITNCVFDCNHAEHAGGAVVGGNDTDITIDGCVFDNNTASEFGGAIAASFLTLGGGTLLTNNVGTIDGGAVYGWDPDGVIVFNDVICTGNSATENGGCFRSAGLDVVNNGTVMHDNTANDGGCIYAYEGSKLHIVGGDFRCDSGFRGGVLLAGDSTNVTISGGLMWGSSTGSRGGAVFCTGYGESTLRVEGGTFRNNTAREYGGAIAATGVSTVVNITGGTFINNTATFYGGCVYINWGVTLTCENASMRYNYAGDQGGGICAKKASWVNSSCDLIGNESPQGAALYLSGVESATLENHAVTNNLALSGSVLYMTESVVVADGVSFLSGIGLQEDSYNRAIQSDSDSSLAATGCVFRGWLGDTVIYHANAEAGSLFLDRCDFSGSSAHMAVFSLNSDAYIRNAVFDDTTVETVGRINSSLVLVNKALACGDGDLCGPGECADSDLGVLCECLDAETCLDDGGALSLSVKTPPSTEVYSPDGVSYELAVSATGSGTTNVIWELTFEADDLELDVAPSSGILPPEGNVSISVSGVPKGQDLGGVLTSSFTLTTLNGDQNSSSTNGIALDVDSTFYLCYAYEYAKPVADEDGIEVSCEPCISIEGGDGVDCDTPGATLASLPIREGYWRSSRDAVEVHKCFNLEGCAGATVVLSADDYCKKGYEGPYCAVCSEGYGRSISNMCLSCDSSNGKLLIPVGVLLSVVMVLLSILLGVVFLVGGLDGVDGVRKSAVRRFSSTATTAQNICKSWNFSGTTPDVSDTVHVPPPAVHEVPNVLSVSRNSLHEQQHPPEAALGGRRDPDKFPGEVLSTNNNLTDLASTEEEQRCGGDYCDDTGELKTESQATNFGLANYDKSTNVVRPHATVSELHDYERRTNAWSQAVSSGLADHEKSTSVVWRKTTNFGLDTSGAGINVAQSQVAVSAPDDESSSNGRSSGALTGVGAAVGFSDLPYRDASRDDGIPVSGRAEKSAQRNGTGEGVPWAAAGLGRVPADTCNHARFSSTHPSAIVGGYSTRQSAIVDSNSTQRGTGVPLAQATRSTRTGGKGGRNESTGACCGIGVRLSRWGSRVPVGKLRILVVVWQILTSFPSITGVVFPSPYAAFLSWVSFVNLDVGRTFSASCMLPAVNFYERLLIATLTPLVLAGVLGLTYKMAKRTAGIGSAGVNARRAAWSRHVAAGLLLAFMVLTTASTLALQTFDCDDAVGDGRSYLRADYSLSCGSKLHIFFKVYAVLMILVYPIGIPALYGTILWRKREFLNPIRPTKTKPQSKADGTDGRASRVDSSGEEDGGAFWSVRGASENEKQAENESEMSPKELHEYMERVRARGENPELTPSKFLWMDFGPDMFYYEVIECCRRLLLTGLLVLVAPTSSTQVATSCIFAFASLLGFELMRPHVDQANAWLYRMGCLVIFLSNFLALVIKMDVAEEEYLEAFAGILVAMNVVLFFSVLFASWFGVRQPVAINSYYGKGDTRRHVLR